jgi:hypothetical protein
MSTQNPTIVSGAPASVAGLGKDEAWLQGWLKEQPSRLGLGELTVADADPVQDEDGNPAFLAADEDRYFSVDVRLGEVEASHGFAVLDNWARNRVRHPDKTHVAVLVTETAGDRYRTTLEALTEHLPLVVVELSVWRGESEAILAPRIALCSDDVDLEVSVAQEEAADEETFDAEAQSTELEAGSESTASDTADTTEEPDPWRLPKPEPETLAPSENGSLTGVAS